MKMDKETKKALAKATVEKVLNVILSKYFTGRGFLLKQEPKICYQQIQAPRIIGYRTKWQAPQTNFAINSDGSMKPSGRLAGVGLIARDGAGLPKAVELSWKETRENTPILPIEALGVMRGIKICLNEGYRDVSIQTDAKYIEELIKEGSTRSDKVKLDADTLKYASISQALLLKSSWQFGYVRRQANRAADFLAKSARTLKEDHRWPNPEKYLHVQDVHVTANKIYMKNAIPIGLKSILIDDMGLFPVIAMGLHETSCIYDVEYPMYQVPKTEDTNMQMQTLEVPKTGDTNIQMQTLEVPKTGDTNIQMQTLEVPKTADTNIQMQTLETWIAILEEHISLKNLECFFVDIFNGERLVEQLEVAVRSNSQEVAYSEKKLAELVLKFDVLNTKADLFGYKDRPIRAHLRLKFYKNSEAKKSITDFLLRPKKRIVLPATQLDWGQFDFDYTSLNPKINTQKARIREYNECKELLRKYQRELNNTTREYDFGIREDNLVYEVPKVLNFESFSF